MAVKYITFPTKRAYGVELELSSYGIGKKEIAKAISKTDTEHEVYVSGWDQTEDNDYWHVKDDSSCGWEIASYKSKGVKDLVNIAKVTDSVAAAGGVVSTKCGLHLHVEVEDFNNAQMATLMAIWMKIEWVVANSIPLHRAKNKYCRLMNVFHKNHRNKDLQNAQTFWDVIKPNLYGNYDRFRRVAVNIWNYTANDGKPTVEFRFPEGTLNSNEVKNWIRLLVRLVDFTKTHSFPSNNNKVSLPETLKFLGLAGSADFFLLSHGMRDTKEWFLHRVLKYSRVKKLCQEAVDELNAMWGPQKAFELSEDGTFYTESV